MKFSPEKITLGQNGNEQLALLYNKIDEWEFADVLIQRHKDSHGKHVALVHLTGIYFPKILTLTRFYVDGPTMRVHVHKNQLGFEVSESELLKKPKGIVGNLMASDAYTINENEDTIRSKFWLPGTSQQITTTMPIVKKKGCYTLDKNNVKFLLPVEDLKRDSLFEKREISPKMIISAVEK